MTTSEVVPYHGSYLMPSFDHARVGDAMHPGVLACEPDATLTEVTRIMSTHHIHCLTVLGVGHDGSERLVWRTITDLDVLRAGISAGAEPRAQDIASTPIVTVSPATPLREAAELMLAQGVSHLLVVDPELQRPTGILSTLDVAGTLAWGEA